MSAGLVWDTKPAGMGQLGRDPWGRFRGTFWAYLRCSPPPSRASADPSFCTPSGFAGLQRWAAQIRNYGVTESSLGCNTRCMSDRHLRYDHPHYGIEFDWLVYDLDGSVSLMMSAGYGPVPRTSYEHFAELDDRLEDSIASLPVMCGYRLEVHPPITTSYERPAQRGLYSYDWQHWDGPYRRASTPDRPLGVADLPPELQRLAVLVQLPVTFSTCPHFDLSEMGIPLALQLEPGDGS
jgi:hypothetical protein